MQGPVSITHNYTPALSVMEAAATESPEVVARDPARCPWQQGCRRTGSPACTGDSS